MQNNLRNYAKIFASLHLLAIRFKLGLPIFEFDEAQYLGKGDLVDKLAKRKK